MKFRTLFRSANLRSDRHRRVLAALRPDRRNLCVWQLDMSPNRTRAGGPEMEKPCPIRARSSRSEGCNCAPFGHAGVPEWGAGFYVCARFALRAGRGFGRYLWWAVDHEGEVLESFVTKRRDKKAALKFLKKSLKRHGCANEFVTDHLRSYGAALGDLGIRERQQTGRWMNNRAENSHLPFRRRERAMLRFRRIRTLRKFAAVHASVSNHFSQDRSLSSRQNFKASRAAAFAEWRGLCAA